MNGHRLRGWIGDNSQLWRRPLRHLRHRLSAWRYRWRHWRSPQPPRVLVDLEPTDAAPTVPPVLGVMVDAAHRAEAEAWLAGQTEPSVALWPADDDTTGDAAAPPKPSLFLTYEPGLDELPPTLVESLLLSAACEPTPLTIAGWAPAAEDLSGPKAHLATASPQATLWRLPGPAPQGPIVARVVPHLTATSEHGSLAHAPASVASGPYLLRGDTPRGALQRQRVADPAKGLAGLPEMPGPPTVLFLLPFLAVGGAERLLFDLLAGWLPRYRCLVVTLEPHRRALGQTLDTCRQLTPHLYTLGDWLPRAAHPGAVEHLLRRYGVESLVCWNGVVLFYDQAAAWKRRWPRLRIYNQLYNHRGGWMAHYGRRFADAVDVHLAVNGAIAEALVARGVAVDRVATVPHGVEIPELPSPAEGLERRRRARHRLGLEHLSAETVVVGTFIRMHPQKRPFDILETARRLSHRPVHFLLVGGGPLDDAIDRRLAASPRPNLSRLGLRDDLDTLYDVIDLCLMTSEYEGLPIFLLDGLARGLPCVATAVGDIPGLLADGGGVLVQQVGDVAALAAGIETLLDADQRQRQGVKGRQTVRQRFGLDAYRRRYEQLIFPADKGDGGASGGPEAPRGETSP